MNAIMAALWQLPVLFCCENNFYAMGTALARSESQTDLCVQAASCGMATVLVDGMDVVAVHEAVLGAAQQVRQLSRPVFMEFKTFRFRAHSMFDPELYRDKQEVLAWKPRNMDSNGSSRARSVERKLFMSYSPWVSEMKFARLTICQGRN